MNDKKQDEALDELKDHLIGAYNSLKKYYDQNIGEAVDKVAKNFDDKVTETMDDACDAMILFSSNLKKKIKDRKKAQGQSAEQTEKTIETESNE